MHDPEFDPVDAHPRCTARCLIWMVPGFSAGFLAGCLAISWCAKSVPVPAVRVTTGPNPLYRGLAPAVPAPEARPDYVPLWIEARSPDVTETIAQAAASAKRLSERLGCGVTLRYRDKEVLVYRHISVEDVVDRYTRLIESDARRKTP